MPNTHKPASTLPYWAATVALTALVGLMQQLDGESEHDTATKVAAEAKDLEQQHLGTVATEGAWRYMLAHCQHKAGAESTPVELPNGGFDCTANEQQVLVASR